MERAERHDRGSSAHHRQPPRLASIVRTVGRAVKDAGQQSRALIEESLPADLRLGLVGDIDLASFVSSHDADMRVTGGDDDG